VIRRLALLAALLAGLAGCSRDPVVVASKTSVQDRIVAEMMASLIEAAGMPVTRRAGLGDSAMVFEALRTGAVDLYPEYTGTALSLIGAPPTSDREAARAQVRSAFAERGLTFLDPLGFESTYVAVARPGFAVARDIATVDDLDRSATDLRIGAAEEFAARPRDGLDPFLDRFGLSDATVTVVPDAAREGLYAALIRGELDLVIGFSTDPEIVDFDLRALPTEDPFFPAYEAMPMARTATLDARPELAEALAPLAGAITTSDIRRMVRDVTIGGRTPEAVARAELARLGLLQARLAAPVLPLQIAVDPAETGGPLANITLRAVRGAMPGRSVGMVPADAPAALLANREARLALLPSVSYFTMGPDDEGLSRRNAIEAVAVVGTADIYALAQPDGPDTLVSAGRIAAGPEGSAAHLLAQMIVRSRGGDGSVVTLGDTGAQAVAESLASGAADAGIVVASRARRDVEMLVDGDAIRLIDAASWWHGPARIDSPFLREFSIPAGSRPGVTETVETLAMQYTLAGPAPAPESQLGQSGPVSFSTEARPLSAGSVRAINAALGPDRPRVGPYLRRAAALDPVIDPPPTALNPAPSQAILAVGILGYLSLAVWLYNRAGRRHS